MKPRKPKRKQPLAQILAYFVEHSKDLANLSVQIALDPPVTIRKALDTERYTRKELREALARLKRSSYLSRTSKGKYVLSSKGRIQALRLVIEKQLSQVGKHWKGKWFVVIFDIPELSRKDREYLWRQLRILGFLPLQKSVWVTPLDIERELLALLKLWNLELAGDVRIMRVDRIMQDQDLKEHFNL